MTILLFIAILAILVLAHEFGHFIVAKKNGVRVEEFGFGFPPRIWGWKKGETLYSINLLPLGGFVKLTGEDGESKIENRPEGKQASNGAGKSRIAEISDPKSFAAKSKRARAGIISAGVLFNVLLAVPILSFVLWWGAPTALDNVHLRGAQQCAPPRCTDLGIFVAFVEPGSPADLAGLKIGDRLQKIEKNGAILEANSTQELHDFIFASKGEEILITISRGEEEKIIAALPRIKHKENQGALGIIMQKAAIVRQPWYLAIWHGIQMTFSLVIAVAIAIALFLWELISGQGGLEMVSGPVGIYFLTGDMYRLGLSFFLNFVATISVTLAVINILPFPALDGGRLLFLGIEAVRGKPISYKISNWTHIIGFVILIFFALIITYSDLQKFIFFN